MENTDLHCDEKELTERAKSGELSVLKEIVECYGQSLLSWAIKRCGDLDDAEDAVQDVYLAAQRFLPGFRGEASLRTWLYKLMISACLRRRRGKKHDPALHVELSHDVLYNVSINMDLSINQPDDVTYIKEMGEVLSEALLELSEDDRAIIMMRDGEEMSLAEISEKLGISVGAVKSRIFRARRRLRQKVEKILHQRTTQPAKSGK